MGNGRAKCVYVLEHAEYADLGDRNQSILSLLTYEGIQNRRKQHRLPIPSNRSPGNLDLRYPHCGVETNNTSSSNM